MSLKVSKQNLLTIVLCAITVVGLILVIVGFVTNYVTQSCNGVNVSTKLADISKEYDAVAKLDKATAKEIYPGFGAMKTFAILTIVAICLTAVCAVLNALIDSKIIKYITIAVGAVTAVMAIIALITAFVFCSGYGKFMNENMGDLMGAFGAGDLGSAWEGSGLELKVHPAVGAWLLTIGGIVGGAATAVSAVKK